MTRMGQGVPKIEGFLVEIPVRELDDPPDGSVKGAASLGESEIGGRNNNII